jgi:Tn3 transposase DDE domain
MLPFAPIASLLIELDHRTGFLGCFTHAGGHKQAQSTDLKRNILAVLIANATNLGLVKMAEACGCPTTSSRGRRSGTCGRRRYARRTR